MWQMELRQEGEEKEEMFLPISAGSVHSAVCVLCAEFRVKKRQFVSLPAELFDSSASSRRTNTRFSLFSHLLRSCCCTTPPACCTPLVHSCFEP